MYVFKGELTNPIFPGLQSHLGLLIEFASMQTTFVMLPLTGLFSLLLILARECAVAALGLFALPSLGGAVLTEADFPTQKR